MRKINWIVLHTAAFAPKIGGVHVPGDCSSEDINWWHEQNGWGNKEEMVPPIGYHFVYRWSGLIEGGRCLFERGAHVANFNSKTLGICYSGHGDYKPWTAEQWEATMFHIPRLMKEYGIPHTKILGHREKDPRKSCPGKLVDMEEVRRRLKEATL